MIHDGYWNRGNNRPIDREGYGQAAMDGDDLTIKKGGYDESIMEIMVYHQLVNDKINIVLYMKNI